MRNLKLYNLFFPGKMLSPINAEEDAKLDAMQRSWQSKRGLSSTSSFFDDLPQDDFLATATPVRV